MGMTKDARTLDGSTFADLRNRLLFRRQFLLGPEPFAPAPGWSCRQLRHGLTLSTHPDLQVHAESLGETSVTLLGFAIDVLNPARTDSEVVHSLAEGASDIRALIAHTEPLAGRWAIIYQNQEGTCLFTDPCGYRTVFYYSDGSHFWCGSQPEIIKANCRLSWNTSEGLLEFLMNPAFGQGESPWVGAQTLYKDVMHLMPNHYLDVERFRQTRFYPAGLVPTKETSTVIESAKTILEGTFAGIARRQNVLQGLTAGWDSRLLLAASRSVSGAIQYYVDRMGVLPEYHPDVRTPRVLARRLGINFQVRNSSADVPGWLCSALSANVTGARMLPKTRVAFANLTLGEERPLIEGQAGEICRPTWVRRYRLDPTTIRTSDILRAFWLPSLPFVIQETEAWRRELSCLDDRLNALVLFAWEQRYGNWGARHYAEDDITGDVLCPFSCRLWIETMLATPTRMRSAPDFQLTRLLIESMWPEALSTPVHHGPMKPRVVTVNGSALRQRVRSCVPSSLARLAKNSVSGSGSAARLGEVKATEEVEVRDDGRPTTKDQGLRTED